MLVAVSVLRGCARSQRSVEVMVRVTPVHVRMALLAMIVAMLSGHHVQTSRAAVSFIICIVKG